MKPLLALVLTLSAATAADLTLLDAGKSDYEIVLPDAAPTPAIDASLLQTARLLQTAFLANKAELRNPAQRYRWPRRLRQSHAASARQARCLRLPEPDLPGTCDDGGSAGETVGLALGASQPFAGLTGRLAQWRAAYVSAAVMLHTQPVRSPAHQPQLVKILRSSMALRFILTVGMTMIPEAGQTGLLHFTSAPFASWLPVHQLQCGSPCLPWHRRGSRSRCPACCKCGGRRG